MKNTRKEEVVWLYELGERNFRRQNLKGKCFRGEDLSGCDFSGCDIRGADFTNAILTGVNFTNTTAGLQKRQAMTLLGVLIAAAIVLGVVAGIIGAFAEVRFVAVDESDQAAFAWITPIVIMGFTFVSLTRSMAVGFGIFAIAGCSLGGQYCSGDCGELVGGWSYGSREFADGGGCLGVSDYDRPGCCGGFYWFLCAGAGLYRGHGAN
jgi:hypothetical protein